MEVASAGPYASLHLTPDTVSVGCWRVSSGSPGQRAIKWVCVCVYNAVIFSAVGFYSNHPNPTCKTALQILKIHIGIQYNTKFVKRHVAVASKPYREIMAVMIEACCW